MHKNIYASGFIYHPPSQQILLQQSEPISNISSEWSLFGGRCKEEQDPEVLFRNLVLKLLDTEIRGVLPVYSYLNDNTGEFQYIFYSHMSELKNYSSKNNQIFRWFTFKEVIKLKIKEQTKHDIVVGQRVIEAALRKSLGEHTFQ